MARAVFRDRVVGEVKRRETKSSRESSRETIGRGEGESEISTSEGDERGIITKADTVGSNDSGDKDDWEEAHREDGGSTKGNDKEIDDETEGGGIW